MHALLLHLLDERGAIRLAFDLAIALGTVAVLAAWSADAVRARPRRRAEREPAREVARAA